MPARPAQSVQRERLQRQPLCPSRSEGDQLSPEISVKRSERRRVTSGRLRARLGEGELRGACGGPPGWPLAWPGPPGLVPRARPRSAPLAGCARPRPAPTPRSRERGSARGARPTCAPGPCPLRASEVRPARPLLLAGGSSYQSESSVWRRPYIHSQIQLLKLKLGWP